MAAELLPRPRAGGMKFSSVKATEGVGWFMRSQKWHIVFQTRLLSSAGLVNYYESEDRRAIHISPITVMVVAAVIGIIVMSFNLLYSTHA